MDVNEGKHNLLTGLYVLDLSDDKASFCPKLLADMGARVIKVEDPRIDDSRKEASDWEESNQSLKEILFLYQNTNKHSITLNLEHPEGRKIFLRLVKFADIIIETYSPGYLSELDLEYERLNKINSGLILVSVTGFGQNGPRSHFKSCDMVAAAYGGEMSVTGAPSLPPLKLYGEQSYYTSSLFAGIGILLALRKRKQTGEGEHIDISLQESVAATLDHVMVRYLYEKMIPKRQGSNHWNHFFIILPCKDGSIYATPFYQWETLVEWVDKEGMAGDLTDKKWNDETYRIEHIDHVKHILGSWTKKYSKDDLFRSAQLMRFPWAPIYSPNEVIKSPQHKERQFFIDMDHPEMEISAKYPGMPYRFSHNFKMPLNPAPIKGGHNDQVYQKELGISEKELEWLYSIQAI